MQVKSRKIVPWRWGRAPHTPEQRVAALVAEAEQPACAIDARGVILAANGALEDLVGYERGELAGRPLSVVSDSRDANLRWDVVEAVFKAQRDRHQVRGRCLSRRTADAIWCRWDFSLVRGTRGESPLAIALVEDLTASVHADSHVRILQYLITAAGRANDTAELLQAAVQVICHFTGCGLGLVWLPDGDSLVCSPIGYLHGYGLDQLRRASIGTRLGAGEGLAGAAWTTTDQAVVELAGEAGQSERAWALDRAGAHEAIGVPIRTPSGVAAVLELFVTSDRGVSDRISLIGKVATELGELLDRRRLSDALRDSEERFRSVSDSAVDAIVSADEDGRLRTWNKGAEQMFGWSRDEVIGESLTVIIPERFRQAHMAGISRVARTGHSTLAGTVIELAAIRRDGSEFPVELSIGMWESAEGRGFSGVIRDVTERKAAEEAVAAAAREVERTNAELETLIYTASHDLKSPMISVLGYLDYLKLDYGSQLGDDGARYLERMTDCTLYMQRLIHDLMELSRVGRRATDAVDVDLDELVHRIFDEVSAAYPTAAFHARGLPIVRADPFAFRQLLTNLIDNAAQHGKRDDLLVVVTSRSLPDGSIELSVKDNGVGIPPQYRELVFGIFERLEGASSDERTGTGMGLAICRKITEQLGGRITIEGTTGTDVRVVLPPEIVRTPRALPVAAHGALDLRAGDRRDDDQEVPA